MHCYVPKPWAKRPRRVGSAAVLFPSNTSPPLLLRVFLCVGESGAGSASVAGRRAERAPIVRPLSTAGTDRRTGRPYPSVASGSLTVTSVPRGSRSVTLISPPERLIAQ